MYTCPTTTQYRRCRRFLAHKNAAIPSLLILNYQYDENFTSVRCERLFLALLKSGEDAPLPNMIPCPESSA